MRIKEITWRSRRDFKAIFQCEYCGFEYEGTGYDDTYFYKVVIPNIKCPKCGEKTDKDFNLMIYLMIFIFFVGVLGIWLGIPLFIVSLLNIPRNSLEFSDTYYCLLGIISGVFILFSIFFGYIDKNKKRGG